jgi:hypothetical protein
VLALGLLDKGVPEAPHCLTRGEGRLTDSRAALAVGGATSAIRRDAANFWVKL